MRKHSKDIRNRERKREMLFLKQKEKRDDFGKKMEENFKSNQKLFYYTLKAVVSFNVYHTLKSEETCP